MTARPLLSPIEQMGVAARQAADRMIYAALVAPYLQCRHCRVPNDEAAIYCAQCGGYLPNADVMEHFGSSVVQFGETKWAVRRFSVAGVFDVRAAERTSKHFKLFAEHRDHPHLKCSAVRLEDRGPGLFAVTLHYS